MKVTSIVKNRHTSLFILFIFLVLILIFQATKTEKQVVSSLPGGGEPTTGPTVTIRDDEIILINGEPFFPIGMFGLTYNDPVYPPDPYQALEEAGFNLINIYDEDWYCWRNPHPLVTEGSIYCDGRSRTIDGCRMLYDNAEAHNLYVFGGRQAFVYRDDNIWDLTFQCAQDRSAFLGFNFDEPIWRYYQNPDEWAGDRLRHDVSLEDFISAYQLIKQNNPNHLVWFEEAPAHKVLGQGRDYCIPPNPPFCYIDDDLQGWINDLRLYSQATDILGVHLYPIPENACNPESIASPYCVFDNPELSVVGDAVKTLRENVSDFSKPVWIVLQHRKDGSGYAPDRKEKRFMAYDSIINGATGVIFYSWGTEYYRTGDCVIPPPGCYGDDREPSHWEATKVVTLELKEITPVLVSPTIADPETQTITQTEGIEVMIKEYNGEKYILAANRHENPTNALFDVTTIWPGEISKDVLFEDRTITFPDGTFTDSFDRYEVHIYGSSLAEEDTTPPTITELQAIPNPVEVLSPVTISAIVTDDVGVASVVIEVEEPDSTITQYPTIKIGDTYQSEIDTAQLGTHIYRIYAEDTSGNLKEATGNFDTLDTTPPTSNSPLDTTYLIGDTATIDWILTDNYAPGVYYIEINGVPEGDTFPWFNGVTLEIPIDSTEIGSDEYTIFFNDYAGNEGIPDTVNITIEAGASPPPPPPPVQGDGSPLIMKGDSSPLVMKGDSSPLIMKYDSGPSPEQREYNYQVELDENIKRITLTYSATQEQEVFLKVQELETPPATEPNETVYMYFNLSVQGILPIKGIIDFAASKEWIKDNSIDVDSITLHSYYERIDKWVKIPTKEIDKNYNSITGLLVFSGKCNFLDLKCLLNDISKPIVGRNPKNSPDDYLYFSATTNKFPMFAITGIPKINETEIQLPVKIPKEDSLNSAIIATILAILTFAAILISRKKTKHL